MKVRVDAEFRKLISPPSDAELTQLRENIKRDGCRDPLVTWNGTLLDGHNRYQFCIAEGIKFTTTELKGIESRDDAKLWIIRNQFGRRNLNQYQRAELALELDEIEKAKAKHRQNAAGKHGSKGGRGNKTLGPKLEQGFTKPKGRTNERLGDIAGIAHNNIHKARVIKNEGDEKLIQKVRSGEVSLDKGYKAVRPTGRANGKPPRRGSAEAKAAEATMTISAAKIPNAVKAIVKLEEITRDSSTFWPQLCVQRL